LARPSHVAALGSALAAAGAKANAAAQNGTDNARSSRALTRPGIGTPFPLKMCEPLRQPCRRLGLYADALGFHRGCHP
jgi:hypothetical protein